MTEQRSAIGPLVATYYVAVQLQRRLLVGLTSIATSATPSPSRATVPAATAKYTDAEGWAVVRGRPIIGGCRIVRRRWIIGWRSSRIGRRGWVITLRRVVPRACGHRNAPTGEHRYQEQ